MKRLTDAQRRIDAHINASALDVGIRAVGKTGSLGHLCLRQTDMFSNSQQAIPDLARV